MSVLAAFNQPLWEEPPHFILHYGFMPGCGGCAATTPIIDAIERKQDSRLTVRRYDVTMQIGPKFPISPDTVPALVLELRGGGMMVRPSQTTLPDYNSIWRWMDLAAGELRRRKATAGGR